MKHRGFEPASPAFFVAAMHLFTLCAAVWATRLTSMVQKVLMLCPSMTKLAVLRGQLDGTLVERDFVGRNAIIGRCPTRLQDRFGFLIALDR